MDECWAAVTRLRSVQRRLCLDCHDECMSGDLERPPASSRSSSTREPAADLRNVLSSGANRPD